MARSMEQVLADEVAAQAKAPKPMNGRATAGVVRAGAQTTQLFMSPAQQRAAELKMLVLEEQSLVTTLENNRARQEELRAQES